MMKERIHFQIDKNHVTIHGLDPKHAERHLKLSIEEFDLIRDVLNNDRYKQAFTLLCQEIVEVFAQLDPSATYAGSIKMDKLWDNQHIREKYDRTRTNKQEKTE